MAYKSIDYKGPALGEKVASDTICQFTIGGAGSRNLRIEVYSSAGTDTAYKLQTSMDGSVWVDTASLPTQVVAGVASIKVSENDADVPLRPIGRLVATGAITLTKVLLAMDR